MSARGTDDQGRPPGDMTREDLLRVIEGYELITERVRTRAGEFLAAWDEMDAGERRTALRRVGFMAAINPWPASDSVIDYFRRLSGLPVPAPARLDVPANKDTDE